MSYTVDRCTSADRNGRATRGEHSHRIDVRSEVYLIRATHVEGAALAAAMKRRISFASTRVALDVLRNHAGRIEALEPYTPVDVDDLASWESETKRNPKLGKIYLYVGFSTSDDDPPRYVLVTGDARSAKREERRVSATHVDRYGPFRTLDEAQDYYNAKVKRYGPYATKRNPSGKLTLRAVQEHARRLGYTVKSKRETGEYTVTKAGHPEGEGTYYTTDLRDAYDTALRMSAEEHVAAFRPFRK